MCNKITTNLNLSSFFINTTNKLFRDLVFPCKHIAMVKYYHHYVKYVLKILGLCKKTIIHTVFGRNKLRSYVVTLN